ncbi:complement receptor type 1 isoform X2 [Antennarius striatus]|uniref:complement receptor type 1 isoform X2 n=1 Tax=Antennarius striatus TaxID=241820 RepID=UPI0035AED3BB
MRSLTWTVLVLSFVSFAAAQTPEKCGPPPEYPHVRLEGRFTAKQTFDRGDKVYYNCPEDSTPATGVRAAQCRDGTWTKVTLKCEKRSCGNAGNLPNGRFRYERSAHIGDRVFAVCNRGFSLKGPSFMTCKRTGWSGGVPRCEAGGPSCPAPAMGNAISSGGVSSSFRVGDQLTFTCPLGFRLHGAQSITCGPDGRWQAPPPQCLPLPEGTPPPDGEALGCGVPDTPGGGHAHLADRYASRTRFNPGDRVHYECDVGYVQVGGSRYRRCVDRKWTSQLIRCERRPCGSAGQIANGRFNYSGVEFGDTATAVCNEGHRLVGKATRNCLSRGWDGRLPVCEAVECGDPPEVTHAELVGQQEAYLYRSIAAYRCRAGVLRGPREIWCTRDGTWNAAPPTCEEVTCPPPNVPGAFWSGAYKATHQYRDTIFIECNHGYTRVGPGIITCGDDGRWSPGLPTCTQGAQPFNWRS